MQQVLPFRRLAEATPHMDKKVFEYINEGQIETFESFEAFNIIAFDWYDVTGPDEGNAQIMIYQDREDLFFFCEDERAERRVHELIDPELREGSLGNEQILYRFFVRLLKDDVPYLDRLETEITEDEDQVLSGGNKDFLVRITSFRKELLRLKRYYEQLDSIFDELSANDNGLLAPDSVRRFVILGSRTERLRSGALNLREYVAQTREAYQAQIDIQQNDIMKIFTVITAIFLPLTLLVGWYGMNFQMPELGWRYSYPAVIVLSVVLVIGLIVYFKKKRWF
jgi:magnesium transporter